MAKKSSVEKNNRRKRIVAQKWSKRSALKEKARDPNISDEERMKAREDLNKMPRNSSPIRIRNRCEITGRPRAFMRRFKVSRLTFREWASFGIIPGITKSSW